EQAHVLKGAHQALLGDLVAGHALYGPAVQQYAARGGLVEAAHAIEHSGLARPVGPYDGENLVALNLELHLVHGQQAAEAHGQPGYLEQYIVHALSSTWGRLTGSSR